MPHPRFRVRTLFIVVVIVAVMLVAAMVALVLLVAPSSEPFIHTLN